LILEHTVWLLLKRMWLLTVKAMCSLDVKHPFGWGRVNCIDFVSFICGKFSCHHLATEWMKVSCSNLGLGSHDVLDIMHRLLPFFLSNADCHIAAELYSCEFCTKVQARPLTIAVKIPFLRLSSHRATTSSRMELRASCMHCYHRRSSEEDQQEE
jgi:hypothetical protein